MRNLRVNKSLRNFILVPIVKLLEDITASFLGATENRMVGRGMIRYVDGILRT